MGWFLDQATQNELNKKFKDGDRVIVIMTQEDWSDSKKSHSRRNWNCRKF